MIESRRINWIRKAVIIIMAAASTMLFNSCARLDRTTYENAIITYLSDKYGTEFTVISMIQEFRGDYGMSVRALCSSDKYDDRFTVMCYVDANVAEDIIEINGQEHSIEDGYVGVLYQNVIEKQLGIEDSSTCIVRCNVDYDNGSPSIEEMKDGMESCLKYPDHKATISVYILTDSKEVSEGIGEKAISLLKEYEPNLGFIYVCTRTNFIYDNLLNEYEEHQNDFGNYLANSNIMDNVTLTSYYGFDKSVETVNIKGY